MRKYGPIRCSLTIGNAVTAIAGTVFDESFGVFSFPFCYGRCGCHRSEDEYDIPESYLSGLGIDSTGAVSELWSFAHIRHIRSLFTMYVIYGIQGRQIPVYDLHGR